MAGRDVPKGPGGGGTAGSPAPAPSVRLRAPFGNESPGLCHPGSKSDALGRSPRDSDGAAPLVPRCHQAAVTPRRSELLQTGWVLPQIPCASFLPGMQEEDALLKLKTRSEKQKKMVSADRAHVPTVSPCPRHVPTALAHPGGLGHSTSWVLQHRGLPWVFRGQPGDVVALQLSAGGAGPVVEPLDLLKPPLSSSFGVRGPPAAGGGRGEAARCGPRPPGRWWWHRAGDRRLPGVLSHAGRGGFRAWGYPDLGSKGERWHEGWCSCVPVRPHASPCDTERGDMESRPPAPTSCPSLGTETRWGWPVVVLTLVSPGPPAPAVQGKHKRGTRCHRCGSTRPGPWRGTCTSSFFLWVETLPHGQL